MLIIKKTFNLLAFLVILSLFTGTCLADPQTDTKPPILTNGEWELMTGTERESYCSRIGNTLDPKCAAIYNEDAECYYTNINDARFDTSPPNCKIEGSRELCQQDKYNKINECIESKETSKSTAIRQYCEELYVCRSNSSVATLSNSESGIPFDSEYFNISDSEKGLIAPNQNTFKTNENGGPIIGTVNQVINLLVGLIGIFALLTFIIGAIFLITANGDDNAIQKGKGAMRYSLIGIIFVMMSYTIVVLVQSILF